MPQSVDPRSGLRAHLQSIPSGPLDEAVADVVLQLLSAVWDDLQGSDQQGMRSDKLWRYESMEWDPPDLSFSLERHGGTVLGSTRAEVHRWSVDVNTWVATCGTIGYRQVSERDKALDVKPLVQEIVQAISANTEDPRLKWAKDGTVCVRIGSVISGNFKQTVQGRRRRFRQLLDPALEAIGWTKVRVNCYRKNPN
jgi:hypothetical protein